MRHQNRPGLSHRDKGMGIRSLVGNVDGRIVIWDEGEDAIVCILFCFTIETFLSKAVQGYIEAVFTVQMKWSPADRTALRQRKLFVKTLTQEWVDFKAAGVNKRLKLDCKAHSHVIFNFPVTEFIVPENNYSKYTQLVCVMIGGVAPVCLCVHYIS